MKFVFLVNVMIPYIWERKSDVRKQTAKWKMKKGEKIRICDMNDRHLQNTIRLLERAAEAKRRSNLQFFLSCPEPNGEMAMLDFDQCVDRAIEAEAEDYLPNIYWKMIEEKNRRESK